MPVATKFAAILMGGDPIVPSGRNNWLDTFVDQCGSHCVAVIAAIGHKTLRHPRYFVKRLPQQFHLCWRCRIEVRPERSAMTIGHEHHFCALPTLGWTDFEAPFFAEAKVPSA